MMLAIAVVAAGIPAGQFHAHADGDIAHEHVSHVAVDEQVSQQGHADSQPPSDVEVLHSHDTFSAVYALLSFTAVVQSMDALVAISEAAPIAAAPLAPRIAPYRPPIV